MNPSKLTVFALGCSLASALAQNAAAPAPIPYSTMQVVAEGDSDAVVAEAVTFDVLSLQEAVDHRSQRIEAFTVDVWKGSDWVVAEHVSSDDLTTVGYRRLIRLKTPVTTGQVRIRITGSRLEPTLAEVGLFRQSVFALPPTISDRDANGLVSLSNTAGCKMVFTIDGTAPLANSPAYKSPFAPPSSGTVQAACLMPRGFTAINSAEPVSKMYSMRSALTLRRIAQVQTSCSY